MSKTKKTRKKKKIVNSLLAEVIGFIVIGFCLFALISMLFDVTGKIGHFISRLFLGLFGLGGYLLPVLVITLVLSLFIQKRELSKLRLFLYFMLFLIGISMVHLFSKDTISTNNLWVYLQTLFQTGDWNNGGLFGGVFSNFFLVVLGFTGSIILFSIASICLIIILTRKSLVEFLKTKVQLMEEKREMKKEEKALLKIEKEMEKDFEKEISLIRPDVKETLEYKEDEKEKTENNIDEQELPVQKHLLEVEKIEIGETDEDVPILLFTEQMKKEIEERKLEGKKVGSLYVSLTDEETVEPRIFLNETIKKYNLDAETETENIDLKKAADGEGIIKEGFEEGIKEDTEKTWQEKYIFEEDEFVEEAYEPYYELEFSEPKQTIERLLNEREDIEFLGFEEEAEELLETSKKKIVLPKDYEAPPITLLESAVSTVTKATKEQILETSHKLEETLKSFGVEAVVKEVSRGPSVTRYELSPGHGVRVSKIAGLSDDIALSLAATSIRIEAPVPGKSVIGIELPNQDPETVTLREVIENPKFMNNPSNISIALGKDIAGHPVVADIGKMPHLLIAGSTGSGKSVCINSIIISILYKASPEEVKFILIDPKVVELNTYNGIPHLMLDVVTDPAKAANALHWAVREMERRYELFAEHHVRDFASFNEAMTEEDKKEEKLAQIVIIIDELSDLMMSSAKEVEDSICRLAQMARAAGIHLVIATQRPSVNVITGLIKANIPSRLAFAVSSGVDSRTILDQYGAEKLLGKGDMLYYPLGMNKPMRIQGAFISSKEIEAVVNYVKEKNPIVYDEEIEREINEKVETSVDEEVDELFQEALEFIAGRDRMSISLLQRQFRIGYNRAARMVDEMDKRGMLGPEEGSRPRKVLLSKDDLYKAEVESETDVEMRDKL